jgi:hypothetical protein
MQQRHEARNEQYLFMKAPTGFRQKSSSYVLGLRQDSHARGEEAIIAMPERSDRHCLYAFVPARLFSSLTGL